MKQKKPHLLTINERTSISANTILDNSIYFPNFRLLFINAEDKYIIAKNKSSLSQFIIDQFPDTTLFLDEDVAFCKDNLVFSVKEPIYNLFYVEFYQFRKVKLSYSEVTEGFYQLNSRFNTIKTFSNLLNRINQELENPINISNNPDMDLSELSLIYRNKSVAQYSPLVNTIKTVFIQKGGLQNIKNLFELREIYNNQNFSNLIGLLKIMVQKAPLNKNSFIVYSTRLLKIVIYSDVVYDSPVQTNNDDFLSNFATISRRVFNNLRIIFSDIFGVVITDLEEIKKIEMLKYFDISIIEMELQYKILLDN